MKKSLYLFDKVAGYYLHYAKHCVIECIPEAFKDVKQSAADYPQFLVRPDGSSLVHKKGCLTDNEICKLQNYIKLHYLEMW